MPLSALLLTLGAAVLHALWNLLLAGSRNPVPVAAVTLLVGVVVFAPVAAITWDASWRVAPYVTGSAAFELVYFSLLVVAYRGFELSLVYPILRGSAPVIVLVVTVVALAVRPGVLQALGGRRSRCRSRQRIAASRRSPRHRARPLRGRLYRRLHDHRQAGSRVCGADLLQHARACVTAVVFISGAALRGGIGPIRAEVCPRALVAGIAALERAPAAAVSAVRESSVLIATILAAVFLHERVSKARLTGAALIVVGARSSP